MSTKDTTNRKRNKSRSKQSPSKSTSDQSKSQDTFIYGLHSVQEAIKNSNRKIIRLRTTRNALSKVESATKNRNIPTEILEPRDLDKILGQGVVHQGVLLEAQPLDIKDISDLNAASPALVLDQITDPHNVGAIIRSAAAFGVSGLIMTYRHSPPLSGVLAKTASGGLEHVPICLVSNLSRALEDLGQAGYWRLGLDSEAEGGYLEDKNLSGAIALVLGAEGKGLRRLTREHCDEMVQIKTANTLASLNVSNAAAVALHSVYSQIKT